MISGLNTLTLLLSLSLVQPNEAQQIDSIAVIISNKVEQAPISREVLLNIYTLRIQNWDDGTRIRVSDYKGDADIRNQFYSYLGTKVKTVQKIWLRAQFTGRISPPRMFYEQKDILNEVLENPGTIGYIPFSAVPEGVHILLIINHE